MPEGIFKCYVHDFQSDSPDEWRDHKATEEHHITGYAKCTQCDKSTRIDVVTKRGVKAPALCDDCADKLLAARTGGGND